MSTKQILTKGIGHTMLYEKNIQLLELHKNTKGKSRKLFTVYFCISYLNASDSLKRNDTMK